MTDKVIAIISTSDLEKARTGLMYSVNALKNNWINDVKIYFFGPAERLILHDKEMQQYLHEYKLMDKTAIACKAISDTQGKSDALTSLGIDVVYIGEEISDNIKNGYTPMIW